MNNVVDPSTFNISWAEPGMNQLKIRLLLADDHPAVLHGIQAELTVSNSITVIGTVRNSSELISALDDMQCDVLVSDYAMPGGSYRDGIALFSLLRKRYPELKIVVLTMLENSMVLNSLIDLGCHCIVSKRDDMGYLTLAVYAAYTNGRYLSPSMKRIAAAIDRGVPGRKPNGALSKRELEIVRFYVSGLKVDEIAQRLQRSKKTISAQKSSAMHKLGILRDADLVRYGMEVGLVAVAESADVAEEPIVEDTDGLAPA
jgi:two-component system capsular synthesis response regulator RcsB